MIMMVGGKYIHQQMDENADFGKKIKQQVLLHYVWGSSDLVRRLLSVMQHIWDMEPDWFLLLWFHCAATPVHSMNFPPDLSSHA